MSPTDDLDHEERAIYWIALAAAVPVVIGMLLTADAFDAGTTISLGLAVLAIVGLVGLHRRRRRAAVPRARVVQRRPLFRTRGLDRW